MSTYQNINADNGLAVSRGFSGSSSALKDCILAVYLLVKLGIRYKIFMIFFTFLAKNQTTTNCKARG